MPVFFSYGRGEHQRLCVGRVVQDDGTGRTILFAAAPAVLPDAGSQQRLFAGAVEFVPVAVERTAAFGSLSEVQYAFGHPPLPRADVGGRVRAKGGHVSLSRGSRRWVRVGGVVRGAAAGFEAGDNEGALVPSWTSE